MNNNNFAGFWPRFLMFIVDTVIMIILFSIGSSLMGLEFTTALDLAYSTGIAKWLSILIPAVYIIGFWVLLGATPGKLIFKAKIVDANTGGKASIIKMILRYICYPVSKIFVGLGFIWIGLDSRKQGWHDKIAGTVVVKKSGHEQTTELPKASDKDTNRWNIGKIIFGFSVILCIGLMFLINMDVHLDPGAKEWLAELNYTEENPMNNGYYEFIAMGIAENQDAHSVGFNFVKEEKEQILNNAINSESIKHKIENVEMDFDVNEIANIFQTEEIFNYCQKNNTDISSLYNQYKFREDRYYNALDKPTFKNTSIPHNASSVIEIMECANSGLLNNLQVLSLYMFGNKEEAIMQFNTNFSYDRNFTVKAENLMSKLVAYILLSRDLKTVDHLIEASNGSYSNIRNYVLDIKPLTKEEKDFTKAAKREFYHSTNQLLSTFNSNKFQLLDEETMNSILAKTKSPNFKPKHTINLDYKHKSFLAELSKLNGKDFVSVSVKNTRAKPSFANLVFNPSGSILTNLGHSIYNSYVGKFHYIDGYLNMLKLKVMILDERFSAEDIPTFLAKHADTLYNPFTEEAISWDAERSMLYFVGPDVEDNRNQSELKVNLEK